MVLLFNKRMQSKPARYATEQLPTGLAPTRKSDAERTLQSYDYVIVGAGTAGSVLASRLSEDPNVTVLVLEAGCDNRGVLESKIPLMISRMFHTDYDWNYYTEPQPQVENRRLFWPRGRIVGGSSSMNAMMMHHCDAHDFNEWANEYGCKGWSYEDLRPYFRKSERFTPNPKRPAIDATHRGDQGVWQTGYSWLTEVGEKGFLGACEQVGIPLNPDINTPKGTLGATRFQTFIDASGKRSSAATAYLPQHVLNRKNLTVATGVVVGRVLFDLTTNKEPTAIGVELQQTRDGPVFQVHARKEVVLCGGAINTPQLLLLSGVGPADELAKLGIPVVKDNANVGRNVKDHLCPSPLLLKAKRGITLDYLTSDIKALPSLARWLITGGGPLTSNSGEVAAFVRAAQPPFTLPASSVVKPKDHGAGNVGPDLELIGLPLGLVHHGESRPPGEADAYSLVACGLRPQSHGTITLKSRDAFDHPLIDPRYWSDEGDNDRSVLMVAIRIMLKMGRSEAMKPFLEQVEPNDDPTSAWWPYSASDIDAITDDQLRKWMGHGASTLYHPVSSARMGTDAKQSVVDLQLRVHGVGGLRVVDASIFPEQVSGHPTAPIIAIAEKASELIRPALSAVMAKL